MHLVQFLATQPFQRSRFSHPCSSRERFITAQLKAEVYAATYEAAVTGGAVSERERAILQRLLDQLGMAAEEATLIEQSVLARSMTTQ